MLPFVNIGLLSAEFLCTNYSMLVFERNRNSCDTRITHCVLLVFKSTCHEAVSM